MMDVILESAARSAALALVAGIVFALRRLRSLDTRRAVWRIMLCAALLMPVLMVIAPPIGISVAPPPVVDRVVAAPSAAGLVAAAVTGPVQPRSIPWKLLATLLYAVVAVGMLARFGAGWFMLRRLRLRPTVATGIAGRVPVLESADCETPFTFGWRDPVVVFPATWRAWPEAHRNAVLTHELHHVANRDFLFQSLAIVHRSLFWFSPMSWWLERRLAEMSEQASDDAVLVAHPDRVAYAELLLHFFSRDTRGRLASVAIPMARGGSAERRIGRILDTRRQLSRGGSRAGVMVLVMTLIPLIWLAAGCSPVQSQSSPKRMKKELKELGFFRFRHEGKGYVVRDAELYREMQQVFRVPPERWKPTARQAALYKQQVAMIEQMAKLDEMIETIERRTGRDQAELRKTQALLGQLQDSVDAELTRLDARRRSPLQADRKWKEFIQKALTSGLAQLDLND